MTPQQAMLVKRSFWLANSRGDLLAGCFLAELFSRDPALWRLFSTDPALPAVKLREGLAAIVASIDRIAPIVPVLEWLAFRGAARGLGERHHVVLADALLAALHAVLGDAFTPAHRQAWWLACRSVIDAMVQAIEAEPIAA